MKMTLRHPKRRTKAPLLDANGEVPETAVKQPKARDGKRPRFRMGDGPNVSLGPRSYTGILFRPFFVQF